MNANTIFAFLILTLLSGITAGYLLAVLQVRYGANIDEMRKIALTMAWVMFAVSIILNLFF